MLACASLGIDVKYATPEGYEPDADIVSRAVSIASANGSIITSTNDPIEAVSDAGVIYTDVFVSMGEEGLDGKMNAFEGFQINEELVSHADSDYLFMHCLPAHRGEEVTDGVIDSKNSIVFDQAENRMWAQMSLLTRMCNEAAWHTYNELY
jgi:ornithine carbamoyltransferase